MSFGEQTDSNSETWRVRRLFHKELYYSSLQLKNPNISNTLTLIQIHAYGEKFIIKKWACYSWLPLKIKAFPRIWQQEKLLRLTSFLILVSVSLSIDHSRFPLFQDALSAKSFFMTMWLLILKLEVITITKALHLNSLKIETDANICLNWITVWLMVSG